MSQKFCNKEFFPHFTLHMLNEPLAPVYSPHIGLSVLEYRNFKFVDIETSADLVDGLKASKSSDKVVRRFAYEIYNEDLTGKKFTTYKFFKYRFEFSLNSFCSHHLNHLINSKVKDCIYGEECEYEHANDNILASIVGYITYEFKRNDIILGYIHCLYNDKLGYNVLYLNILSSYYEDFEYESLYECVKCRFRNDVVPALLPLMTNETIGEFDDFILKDKDHTFIFKSRKNLFFSRLNERKRKYVCIECEHKENRAIIVYFSVYELDFLLYDDIFGGFIMCCYY